MRTRVVPFVFVAMLVAAGAVQAAMIPLSRSQLAAGADLILTGTVTEARSSWNDDASVIYTDVTVAVSHLDKGSVGRSVVLRVPGGEVGDIGMAVEDVPVPAVGDRATFYLTGPVEPGVYRLFGGGQGVVSSGLLDKPAPKLYSYSGYHRSPASCYYHTNTSLPGDWVGVLQSADAAWDGAGSVFRFYYEGTTGSGGPTYDGINVVTRTNMGSGGILAQNTYWYIRRTKVVVENDIVFNSYYPWSTSGSPSAYDVQNIGTHEMGHSLVLNDLYQAAQAEQTMYGYANVGETKKQTLEQGDVDGVIRIYGVGVDAARPAARAPASAD